MLKLASFLVVVMFASVSCFTVAAGLKSPVTSGVPVAATARIVQSARMAVDVDAAKAAKAKAAAAKAAKAKAAKADAEEVEETPEEKEKREAAEAAEAKAKAEAEAKAAAEAEAKKLAEEAAAAARAAAIEEAESAIMAAAAQIGPKPARFAQDWTAMAIEKCEAGGAAAMLEEVKDLFDECACTQQTKTSAGCVALVDAVDKLQAALLGKLEAPSMSVVPAVLTVKAPKEGKGGNPFATMAQRRNNGCWPYD